MRQSDTTKFLIAGAAVIVVSLAAGPVLAQNALDEITNLYRDNTAAMGASLRNYAIGLFALLATLEFAWSFTRLALRGGDFGDFMGEFVTRLMTILFFYWLMTSSGEIATAIVNSFREAGNTAAQSGGGSGGMRPSDIWNAGATMADQIMSTEVGLQDIPKGIALMIAGIVMVCVFAILAALMIIALVESYLVMAAAVLLMGFGGSSWTKDIAIKTLTYCVSVGAKLFTIQIIVGLAEAMIRGWLDGLNGGAFAEDMRMVCEILGASVVMLALAFTVPSIVQSMINGSSMASANPVGAAAAAVAGGVVGAGAMAIGGGMAMTGAAKLASEQLKSSDAAGTGPTTGLGRAGAMIGGTMSNLAKGTMNDAGQRLAGRVRSGNQPASVGAALMDQAGSLQRERERPAAPAPFAMQQPSPVAAGGAGGAEGGTITPEAAGAPNGGGGPGEGADPIRGAAPSPEPKLASSGLDPAATAATGPGATVAGATGSPAASGGPSAKGGTSSGDATAGAAKSATAGLGPDHSVERMSPSTTISGAQAGGPTGQVTDGAATATPGQGDAATSVTSALAEAARADERGPSQTVQGANSTSPVIEADGNANSGASIASTLADGARADERGQSQTVQGANSTAPGGGPAGGAISGSSTVAAASAPAAAAAAAGAMSGADAPPPSTGATIDGASASAPQTPQAPQAPTGGDGETASAAPTSEALSAARSGTVQGAPPTAEMVTADPAKSEPVKTRRKGVTLSERASGVRPAPKTPKSQ